MADTIKIKQVRSTNKTVKTKNNRQKFALFQKNIVPLHPLNSNRDVAQLVAHYVRDVGVGRSSRLIPTL